MNILRLNFGHNSSFTLLKKGLMVLSCEEERYVNEKHTRSFPINAINNCLKTSRTKVKDIYYISWFFSKKIYWRILF